MSKEGKGTWNGILGKLFGLAVVAGTFAGSCVAFKPAPEPPPTPMGPLQPGVDYAHSDLYPKGWRSVASAEACSYMCYARPDCKAMTYVVSEQSCWLKSELPAPKQEADMISAVKQ